MSEKSKKDVEKKSNYSELHDEGEKKSIIGTTQYVQSFVTIAVVTALFLVFCYLSFKLLDLLTPLIKIAFGSLFLYLLLRNEHFHAFRHSVMNSNYGFHTVWQDFLHGFESLIGEYLGHDWLQKILNRKSK